MKTKIKRGEIYYLVLHKRDWSYKPAVIIPVKVIRRQDYNWVIVEQTIENIKHRLTVHVDWLAPYDIQKAQDLLSNMKMWEKRWGMNSWRSRLNHKTVHQEVMIEFNKLSKKQREKIWTEFTKIYPELVKEKYKVKRSKMKMKIWDEFAWAIIATKFPMKEVW